MITVTSKDVQTRYGEFVESLQDDVACVTRHGRPLFWAISDRQMRAKDPSELIGRLLLLNGQLRKENEKTPKESFAAFLDREIDPSLMTDGITVDDVTKIVNDNRG
jgi:hypothetical protein